MTQNPYNKSLPQGWVEAKYETATHYLIGYLMEPGCEFEKRWSSFIGKWENAKGLEMRIKQQEIRHEHQGFGNVKMREAVQRALKQSKTRAYGTIDILRLDKILVAEKLSPMIALDPKGFIAKTPGSKKEAKYRKHGVPDDIADEFEALRYIKGHGPPISQTASTKARGNRDPRIKAQRCVSEWVRWIEVQALDNLIANLHDDNKAGDVVVDREEFLKILR